MIDCILANLLFQRRELRQLYARLQRSLNQLTIVLVVALLSCLPIQLSWALLPAYSELDSEAYANENIKPLRRLAHGSQLERTCDHGGANCGHR